MRVVAAAAAAAGDAASALVSGMSLRDKAASVVMGHIPTTDAGALASYMAGTGIGGFILMGANVPATEGELRALTAALTPDAALPPLIAIDQEGGDVSRLPWDDFPSALTLKDQPRGRDAGRLRRTRGARPARGDRRQLRHRGGCHGRSVELHLSEGAGDDTG